MTKQDFELIASVIKSIKDIPTRQFIADKFARELEAKNPRFDAMRFINACDAQVLS